MINQFINKIYSYFFERNLGAEWIIFFRIAIGVLCLLHFVAILPDFNRLFSNYAYIPIEITYAFSQTLNYYDVLEWSSQHNIDEQVIHFIYKSIYISSAIFLAIGFLPRVNAFVLLLLQLILIRSTSFYAYGVDYFTGMSLFYLILIPSDYKFAINKFIWKKIEYQNITPYFRLLQIHLSVAYFFSGLGKILGFNWRNGEAIFKAINLPYANRDFYFDFSFMANYPLSCIFVAWFTILIELCHPIFMLLGYSRLIGMYLTISMHLGIALVLNLYFFSAIMIIWNITAFYFYNHKSFQLKA